MIWNGAPTSVQENADLLAEIDGKLLFAVQSSVAVVNINLFPDEVFAPGTKSCAPACVCASY